LDLLFSHKFNYDLSTISQPGLSLGDAAIFYDGVSIMARGSSEIVDWAAMDGLTVCVLGESPTIQDLSAEAARQDVDIDLLTFESIAAMSTAFFEGRCAAQALERSLLEIIRQSSATPDDFAIWSQPITIWPIRPIFRAGDPQWTRVVDAVLWGLIQAEALEVSSANVDQMLREPEESIEAYIDRVGQDIANLLSLALGENNSLGLPGDYLVAAIRQVGKYGEIYDRHLGPNSNLPLERGLNELWFREGLLTTPRWR
jgi:general L-amino acid transport system substrate-binding protein